MEYYTTLDELLENIGNCGDIRLDLVSTCVKKPLIETVFEELSKTCTQKINYWPNACMCADYVDVGKHYKFRNRFIDEYLYRSYDNEMFFIIKNKNSSEYMCFKIILNTHTQSNIINPELK